jgi:hypothetical protein
MFGNKEAVLASFKVIVAFAWRNRGKPHVSGSDNLSFRRNILLSAMFSRNTLHALNKKFLL